MEQKENINMKPCWVIGRYANRDDYEAGVKMQPDSVIEGNLLLNEGITALMNLLAGVAETAFGSGAYIGVGDSAVAAAATQTGLQASPNKLYVQVESAPTITAQSITWRSVFDGNSANFGWQEFTVANGSSDAADNLNRKVSDQGTKVAGQVWTIDLQITFS